MGGQPLLKTFLKEQGVFFRVDEPLCKHGTWRIGGPADFLVEPVSWEQVAAVLDRARQEGMPTVVIGKGSNLLFDDAGVRGVAIKIGRPLASLTIEGSTVRAGSGISASRLARAVGLRGLSDLEHIVGIPGTLGGLVLMNGGSLRKGIGDSIVEVKTLDRQGDVRTYAHHECDFAYRHSRFQGSGQIVTEVTMELTPGDRDSIMTTMLAILRQRRAKLPLTWPNCGSVFKSDPRIYGTHGPPGKIVEELGFKGAAVGDAVVSDKHANFIINRGRATARDVTALIDLIRQRAVERFGIHLECEVQFVPSTGAVRALQRLRSQRRFKPYQKATLS